MNCPHIRYVLELFANYDCDLNSKTKEPVVKLGLEVTEF